jgi:hypothetical protein
MKLGYTLEFGLFVARTEVYLYESKEHADPPLLLKIQTFHTI